MNAWSPILESGMNTDRISRRAFVRDGSLLLSAATLSTSASSALADDFSDPLKIGLVTDLHYADKPPAGTRHYRDTPAKLATAAKEFAKNRPDFVVELGDLIDAADSVETELGYLDRINRDFSKICERRHYVLGNHCVQTLTKPEFLNAVGQPKSFYSFDAGDFHFVVLDACFRADGEPYGRKNFKWTDPNIPAHETEWLKSDLAATDRKTIVFAHQRLDVSNNHGVKNAKQVRDILERSGKVTAVFQGHSHKNDHHEINGIHYCTLVAMIEGSGNENNGFSMMQISKSGSVRLDGFVKQDDYTWQA